VQFADAATRILVMVPLPGQTFTVLGIPQNLVLLVVTDDTVIERRTSNGLVPIGFGDIVPGLDQVVFRGEAASPSTVVATSLRVQRE
jgi:isopentenyl phosphate kinase